MRSQRFISVLTAFAMCAAMIAAPLAHAEGEAIYTSANGWTLNGSEEQEDSSLAIKAGGTNPTVFSPELEYGKKYSITYDVTGLTTDSGNAWAYPFRVKLSAGGEDVDGALAYRMVGRWNYGSSDALVAMGTNGTNEIIYDTVSGDWQSFALGSFGTSGTFADPSDFAIRFYRWSDLCQVCISNVTVTDITSEIYNSVNGWSLGAGAEEQQDGSLKLAKTNYSWFAPALESGRKYEISYDVNVTVGGEGIWAKPFQMSVETATESKENILNCYCTTGVWADTARVAYGATGTSGKNKIFINTETGEWSVDILGTGNGPSGTFGDLSGFRLGFRCEPYLDPEEFPSYISNVTVADLGAAPTRYYTKTKGWTLNGSVEQEDGRLAIVPDGNNPTVYKPELEYGKKYSITYDVTGLETGEPWHYPFRIKLSAGSETVDGALAYRMSGRWAYGSSDALVAMGTNGTNEIIFDTVTGGWETYALGSFGTSGTFADPSGFAIKFYRYQNDCQAYISNVTVTDITPVIYNSLNGWTLNGSEEQEDGSLAIKAGGNTPTVFSPTLESGKKYSITYDVTGLETDSENTWAYPFRVQLSSGSESEDGALQYRMGGTWESGANSKAGTNGKNEIIIDTNTGEWETYALGQLAKSGTFTDPSHFVIKFYRWSALCQSYISNVTVTDITSEIYNSANGWSLGFGAAEQEDGSLKLAKTNYSWFTPVLESGKKYEISYDVNVTVGGESSWAKPFQMSVETATESKENILNCYCTTGFWADTSRVSYDATGTSGTNKVYINTETGEWSVDILGTGNGPSGTFDDLSGFRLGFRCEPYLDPEEFPSYISNVTVTDLGASPNVYYTKSKGWTLNGSEEQEDGSLAIKAGGNTPTVFSPSLEYGKKYSIKYDVTGLTTDSGNAWAYPFRVKVSAGGEDVDGALVYRMAGRWAYGSSDALVAMGTNGTNEIIYDTVSGEWETYALGSFGTSGTFADPSGFAIRFYRWAGDCQVYISNVKITEFGSGGGDESTPVLLSYDLTSNGAQINTPDGLSSFNANLHFEANDAMNADVTAFAAVYDADGNVVSIGMTNKTISGADVDVTVPVTLSAPYSDSENTLKIFIWDGALTMRPYHEVVLFGI